MAGWPWGREVKLGNGSVSTSGVGGEFSAIVPELFSFTLKRSRSNRLSSKNEKGIL